MGLCSSFLSGSLSQSGEGAEAVRASAAMELGLSPANGRLECSRPRFGSVSARCGKSLGRCVETWMYLARKATGGSFNRDESPSPPSLRGSLARVQACSGRGVLQAAILCTCNLMSWCRRSSVGSSMRRFALRWKVGRCRRDLERRIHWACREDMSGRRLRALCKGARSG